MVRDTRLLWLFLEVVNKILVIARDKKSEDYSGPPCIMYMQLCIYIIYVCIYKTYYELVPSPDAILFFVIFNNPV